MEWWSDGVAVDEKPHHSDTPILQFLKMAKNRKYQSAAVRFGPALKAFLLCALLGGSGVGYVWQRNQIDELGRQIANRETRLAALRDQNKKLRDQLQMLRSPKPLEQRVRELKLGLGQLQPGQVWPLPEPPAPLAPPNAQTGRQFAGRQTRESRLAGSP
jgi:cell division protein FtsB